MFQRTFQVRGQEKGQATWLWRGSESFELVACPENELIYCVCVCVRASKRVRVVVYPLSSIKHFRINLFVESCL